MDALLLQRSLRGAGKGADRGAARDGDAAGSRSLGRSLAPAKGKCLMVGALCASSLPAARVVTTRLAQCFAGPGSAALRQQNRLAQRQSIGPVDSAAVRRGTNGVRARYSNQAYRRCRGRRAAGMRWEYVNAAPAGTCTANITDARYACENLGSGNHYEYLQALRLPAFGRLDRLSRSLT